MLSEIWAEISNDLWFQVAMLLAISIATSMVFVRIGLPKTVGQIIIGIIIGPSVLGLIILSSETGGDSTDNWNLMTLLATFGATIMLFVIGLECDFKEIYTKKNISIAIGGITLPWLGGFALASTLLPGADFAQSVFIGTALVATSVAITGGVMREMGIMKSATAKTILGAAVVDDVLGMIVLAISIGVGSGTGIDIPDLALISIAAVLFVVGGTFVGSRIIVNIIGMVERQGLKHGIPESGFILALSFAFIYAFVSNQIGISAIVGAFVAGTSFSRCEYRKQFRDGIIFLEWIFAPIFFISLGVLVDISLLPFDVWIFAIVLAGVAILTKVVGSAIPARAFGLSKIESVAIGLGMAARLEVAMIIALYGLNENIIDNQIYSVIVVMGVITVLIAPTLLRMMVKRLPKDANNQTIESCEIQV